MHSMVCFSGAVGADESEDFALVDREGCFVDGDGAAVGLADGGDLDDWGHGLAKLEKKRAYAEFISGEWAL
jgi:hypothetical protein